MTIKKRLSISNVLMIIIPIVITITIFITAFIIINVVFDGALFETIHLMEEEREQSYHTSIQTIKGQLVVIAVVAVAGLFAVLYFTNRFLIRFVFNKIQQPLEILSKGVHQIKNGNLDYRIVYYTEDEFRPICEDFNEMAARLKASVDEGLKNEQNRKELLAGISHDLRSPLTSIKAFVEGISDGVASTPEMRREYLDIIIAKTDDINNMVSQLFLFSKMDMGNYPVNPERLYIGAEISDFVNASREDYKVKGLLIELGSMPEKAQVYADPAQLRSVFANILDNSAKYKGNDIAKAVVRCELGSDALSIIFEDDGPGVPLEALPKLFDVFYRGDLSRSNPQQGSGLGLAISKKAIERMRGRICAENRAEGGLRIVAQIPMIGEEKTE